MMGLPALHGQLVAAHACRQWADDRYSMMYLLAGLQVASGVLVHQGLTLAPPGISQSSATGMQFGQHRPDLGRRGSC